MKKIITLTAVLILFTGCFKTVEGNERTVVQDWNNGVLAEVLGPGTHVFIPKKTTLYTYNVGAAKFIMGNQEFYGEEKVDYPPFTITTGGSGSEQPATFSVTLNYHLDPSKLHVLHSTTQSDYEDLRIKPALTRIISDLSTVMTVLDFYSGTGRVNLQKSIESAILSHPALSEVGIVVDTFVIDDIELDELYVAEITGRQLATQKTLRAIEETKAAVQVANRVEAEAGAEKLKKIVEANTKKEQRILAAKAKAEEVTLAAQAKAKEVKLAAEADRYSKEEDAKGLLAQGLAEAKVAKEKRDSKYAGVSGSRQAQVEIERARVEMFKNMNIKGIVTEKTVLSIINGTAVTPTLPAVPSK